MSFPVLILLIVFLAALWWFLRLWRAAGKPDEQPALAPRRQDTRYHAVSIKYAPTACKAAKELAGRRFLATAAPRLPLSACNVSECQCRFVHHDDRRSGKDRRSPFAPAAGSLTATGELQQEQREGRDRRRDED
ncbi:MAG: hypothetical protein R3176_10050 [Woeseiaceae bacterium]|nr:hypothetical protein [Woeseiaceae bacterium]